MRFKNFTNRLDDTSTINKTKRDLARVKTLLRQAELNKATADAPKAEAKPAAKAAAPKAPKKTTAKKSAAKSEAK